MIETRTVVICDWCGKEIHGKEKELQIGIDGDVENSYDVCSECFKKLKFIMNWRDNQNSILSMNFNHEAEITLGADGVEAWNNRFSDINVFDNKKDGDIIHSQLHEICRGLAPAFEKITGCYQGVAFPFELRFPIKSLKLKEE